MTDQGLELPTLDPFTTWLDLDSGSLDPERGVLVRRISDMVGYYLDEDDVPGERLVYKVLEIPVPETNDEIQCSTTILEPGLVGGEYHMTKGHFHQHRSRSEIYIGLEGEGLLLMATEDGRHATEPLARGSVSYVPGGWAHRSVNTGEEPLVFFAAYVGDAGHNYGTIADQGFPVIVTKGGAGPEIIVNPLYRG